jgi:SAM-dependent methyltransferase
MPAVPGALYESIADAYVLVRGEDPRIAARIHAAIGDARSVVNVGAGTGAYEPADRELLAVDPSPAMIARRPPGAAPAIEAHAEQLPLADGSFDAALAVLTVHHWRDLELGLAELRRVARHRVVVFSFDPAHVHRFWLVRDYLPVLSTRHASFPSLARQVSGLGGGPRVEAVPIPHDCRDGFLGAYWRRPSAYLDRGVRAGVSTFAELGEDELAEGLSLLGTDVATGAWRRRNRELVDLAELDLGYRLLVAELTR